MTNDINVNEIDVIDILYNLISNVLINNCVLFIQPINLFFLYQKKISEEIIQSFIFGIIFFNYACIPLSLGAMAVFDSFASFSTGSSNYRNLRKVLNRSRVVLFFLYMLVSLPLAIYSDTILFNVFSSQDSFLLTKEFVLISVHGINILLNHILNLKYLQALGHFDYCILINLSHLIITILTSYVFIIRYNLSLLGVAYSILLSSSIIFLVSLRYMIVYSVVKVNLYKFNQKVFKNPNFIDFLILSFESSLINFFEYVFLFLIITDIYRIPNSFQSRDLMIINYLYLMKSFGFGSSQTLAYIIGQNLSKRNFDKIFSIIDIMAKITIAICTCFSLLNLFIAHYNFNKENIDHDLFYMLISYSFYIFIDYGLALICSAMRLLNKYNYITLLSLLSMIAVIYLNKIFFDTKFKAEWLIYIAVSSVTLMLKSTYLNVIDS